MKSTAIQPSVIKIVVTCEIRKKMFESFTRGNCRSVTPLSLQAPVTCRNTSATLE